MTRTILPSFAALPGLAVLLRTLAKGEARDDRRPKGWEGALLDMLRHDATNIDYLVHGFQRAPDRVRRWEGAEAEELM